MSSCTRLQLRRLCSALVSGMLRRVLITHACVGGGGGGGVVVSAVREECEDQIQTSPPPGSQSAADTIMKEQ